METLIYCYLPISYLIMLGYIFEIMGDTSMVYDYIEQSLFNYEECKIDVIVIFLLSPLIIPFLLGGLLCSLTN